MGAHRFAPALVPLCLAATIAAPNAAAAKPTPTPLPTIKPMPKGFETVQFNGRSTTIKGFLIMVSPTPLPSPTATPTQTPLPNPSASPKASASPNVPKPKIPTMEQLTAIDHACTAGATPCSHVFVRAKDFFKLVGAKIAHVEDQAPAGPITVTFCKKNYAGMDYLNNLATLGGKPNVDPIYFLNAFNRDIAVGKFTYSVQLPSDAAFAAATKEHAAYQPSAVVQITGPIACKAKKHKPNGAYELEMDSSLSTFTSQTDSTLASRVTADFALNKASGSVSTMKTPHTIAPPSTKIAAVGSGDLTLASYSIKATCDSGKSVVVATDPYNGEAAATLVGSGDNLALLFNAGQPPAGRWPGVSLECEGHGADSGPAIWFASFMAAHKSELTAGMDLGGGMMGAALVIPLEKSVDGTYEAHYSRTTTVGSSTITETTTFTLTKNQ